MFGYGRYDGVCVLMNAPPAALHVDDENIGQTELIKVDGLMSMGMRLLQYGRRGGREKARKTEFMDDNKNRLALRDIKKEEGACVLYNSMCVFCFVFYDACYLSFMMHANTVLLNMSSSLTFLLYYYCSIPVITCHYFLLLLHNFTS